MRYHRTLLTNIFTRMQNLGGIIWTNSKLDYCIKRDTLHMFNRNSCYNCKEDSTPKIEISESPKIFNIKKFKDYLGSDLFYPKLIEMIDYWPEKNKSLFNYLIPIKDPKEKERFIKICLERKELYSLYCEWETLATEEKFDEIFDFEKIQERNCLLFFNAKSLLR